MTAPDADIVYWCVEEAGPLGAGLANIQLGDWLSPAEQNRLDRMRFPKRRSDWLLGRVTAKKLLKECLADFDKLSYSQITIDNHPEGAPFVTVNGNMQPLQLSISHREGMAVAALCQGNEIGIGIDLEWVEAHPRSFYNDFFTTGELELLAAVPDQRIDWAGTLIWSAKEAVLKALGKGLRLDTRSVDITNISDRSLGGWGSYGLRIANFNEDSWHCAWRDLGLYVLTLAVRNKNTRPVLRRIG